MPTGQSVSSVTKRSKSCGRLILQDVATLKLGARDTEACLLNCLVSDVYCGYRPERDEPLSQLAVPTTDFQNPRPFKVQRGNQAENLIAPAERFYVDGLQVLRIPGIPETPLDAEVPVDAGIQPMRAGAHDFLVPGPAVSKRSVSGIRSFRNTRSVVHLMSALDSMANCYGFFARGMASCFRERTRR